jgi:hypothetical protein
VWSPNGHELFYREDQRIVVKYVVKGDAFIPEKPRLWSAKPLANVGTSPNYDLAPAVADGPNGPRNVVQGKGE